MIGSGAYTAPAAPVFDPSTIPGLTGWYDFSDISTLWKDTARTVPVTTSGDVIKGVTDKSGQAKHLAEATNGPAYIPAVMNGKAVSRYTDAGGTQLKATITLNQPYTYFVVGSVTVAATTQYFLDGLITTNIGLLASVNATTVRTYAAAGPPLDQTVTQNTSPHVLGAVFDQPSNSKNIFDGTVVTGNTGTSNSTGVTLGRGAAGDAGTRLTGDIGLVLVYNVAVSAGNITVIANGLKSNWGL